MISDRLWNFGDQRNLPGRRETYDDAKASGLTEVVSDDLLELRDEKAQIAKILGGKGGSRGDEGFNGIGFRGGK